MASGFSAPPPFSMPREAPIAPIAAAIQMFDDAIQATSVSTAALGHTDPSVKSKAHANLLREQAQQGTSNYLDNLVRSMRYEAQIINNLLYPIYGRPGRLARIVNGEGESQSVLLHRPMIVQGDRPMPAPEGAPQAKTYTLTKDVQFNVAVKVSKNYDTRRQQEATTIGELLSGAPELMTWFGDLFFKNQDGPGHMEMADRAKVMLDPKILQMIEAKKQGAEIPPQVQAQLAQLQQQNQELQQAAGELQTQLQTDAVKEQAETARKAAQLESERAIAQLKADTEIAKAEIDARTKLQLEELKLRGAAMQAEIDAQQNALGAARQSADKDADRAHESSEAAAAREAQSVESERARQAAAEEAERAREAAETV